MELNFSYLAVDPGQVGTEEFVPSFIRFRQNADFYILFSNAKKNSKMKNN